MTEIADIMPSLSVTRRHCDHFDLRLQNRFEPLMKTPAAAAYVGVGLKTLNGWREQGYGPACFSYAIKSEFGKAPPAVVRWRRGDLDTWLKEQAMVTATGPAHKQRTRPTGKPAAEAGATAEGNPWWTPPEAAAYLNVTVGTLSNWRAAGKGPPYARPGVGRGRIRYRKSDVDGWVEANMVGGRK